MDMQMTPLPSRAPAPGDAAGEAWAATPMKVRPARLEHATTPAKSCVILLCSALLGAHNATLPGGRAEQGVACLRRPYGQPDRDARPRRQIDQRASNAE